MAYDLTGKIKVIKDAETFGTFTKRELIVIVEDGKYPQEIVLEFVQDKVSLLDALAIGQEVTITFDIRGREWEGHNKWFNSLQAWKVVASDGAEYVPAEENLPPVGADETDDIPF